MQLSQPPSTSPRHCPICRATIEPALPFCPVCGAELDKEATRVEEELRGVLYLLSELKRWESTNRVTVEQAAHLRRIYERRRDQLRRKLSTRESEQSNQAAPSTQAEPRVITQTGQAHTGPSTQTPSAHEQKSETIKGDGQFAPFPSLPRASNTGQARASSAPPPTYQRPQRTLLERLAEPQTLRLLLYTGAGMLVVGVVIWLRDLLYLKLQEPVVQAGLLAFGTAAFIASGWYTILRTRQRWTGRALTLAGSLLVPVNFWFLVRSGLIESHGRAWIVCAFCALLYAYTAAILRERLYVYLACTAVVATLWALIFRDAPRAYGLYALSLMAASLVFLHLSRLFPHAQEKAYETPEPNEADEKSESVRVGANKERWSYELWGAPLSRTALLGSALSVIFYMPLRTLPDASSFYNRLPLMRASTYDPGVALLLLAGGAYVLWFVGQYIHMRWRVAFHSLSVMALFSAAWAACDGFRLRFKTEVLALTLLISLAAITARLTRSRMLAQSLHHACLISISLLAIIAVPLLLSADQFTYTESASLALIAITFALLSTERFSTRIEQIALSYFAALYLSASYFVALAAAPLQSETLITLLFAVWPLALYGAAELTVKVEREMQLSSPFMRVADAQVLLLLIYGSVLALLIHLIGGGGSRASAQVALFGVVLYCVLRSLRERSVYGACLGTMAAVAVVAAALDALRKYGLWPADWPIAAGPIVFAFLLDKAVARLLRQRSEVEKGVWQPLATALRVVLDLSVVACAILWLIIAFSRMGTGGGFAAPAVLLLALLYWIERAADLRQSWIVRVAAAHMCAFLFALLVALRVEPEWLNLLFVLITFTTFFALSHYVQRMPWLSQPLSQAAGFTLALSLLLALIQSGPHLQAGNVHLLAPSMTLGAIAMLSFIASMFSKGHESVLYFRAGLWVAVVSLMLASLRAGFDPLEDAEVYTTPIALLMLTIAYLSHRRAWTEYEKDVGALLWAGSLLLCMPLLLRSVELRLLLDARALGRDMAVLVASLALILYGVVGRMRAPVIVGSITLITELVVLTLTSVDWLQVPIKYYLMTVGALLLIIFGVLEYRREQFLLMRKRFQQRRDAMREQFGEWR